MTAEQVSELLKKMNEREKKLTIGVIDDIQTYKAEKRVPLKVKIRDDATREPVNLRLVAQALHLSEIDIASTQAAGVDEKGPFVAFHPKPLGGREYQADPGKIEPATAQFDDAIETLLQRVRKEGGQGPLWGSTEGTLEDLF